MTYRSLLVHLDQDRRAEVRLAYALRFAPPRLPPRRRGTHGRVAVTAEVSVEAASLSEYAQAAWMMPGDHAQGGARTSREACRGRSASDQTVSSTPTRPSPWCGIRTAATSSSSAMPTPAAELFGGRELVAEVVLGSARPTIVLPSPASSTRSLRARWWPGTTAVKPPGPWPMHCRCCDWPSACRSSPGLDSTDLVTAPRGRSGNGAVQQWLGVAGSECRAALTATCIGLTLAEVMLSDAAHFEADLIVMRGNGHSRWTERILGGATRGMLDSMH